MPTPRKLTPEQRDEVIRLHGERVAVSEIARRFKVSPPTVYRIVDPTYNDRRRAQDRKKRVRISEMPHAGFVADRRSTAEDAARLMAEVPSDTRSLTARICGDPLPGRSALDRRSV